MGEQKVTGELQGASLRVFTKRLLKDLSALERMLHEGALDAQDRPSVDSPLPPHSIGLADGVVTVGQKWKVQVELRPKVGVGLQRIRGDTEHDRVDSGEPGQGVAEVARLNRTPRCVVASRTARLSPVLPYRTIPVGRTVGGAIPYLQLGLVPENLASGVPGDTRLESF